MFSSNNEIEFLKELKILFDKYKVCVTECSRYGFPPDDAFILIGSEYSLEYWKDYDKDNRIDIRIDELEKKLNKLSRAVS